MSSGNTSQQSAHFKYRAFISYSSQDRELGERFQKALEDFRVPRALRGRKTIAGTVGKRLVPIFRDRSDLEGHADLGARIEQALEESGALIVLCSPASASSKWVNKEIATFKQMRKADRIFAVILEGEPKAWPGGVFPPCLSYRVDDAGEPTAELEPREPLAVDVRQEGDGWEASVEKIAASLLGVSLTELRDRVAEAERRDRRVRQQIIAGVSALAVVATIAAGAAYLQRQDALVSQSRALARLAMPLIEQERYADAQLLALEGLPASKSTLWPRPLDAYAEVLLTRARYSSALNLIISGKHGFMNAKFSGDGRRILTINRTGIEHGEAQVWDAQTGLAISPPLGTGELRGYTSAEFSPNGRRIVAVGRSIQLWSEETGWTTPVELAENGEVSGAWFSPDGNRIVAATYGGVAKVWNLSACASGTCGSITLNGHSGPIYAARFSPDGRFVVTTSGDMTARVWDLNNCENEQCVSKVLPHEAQVYSADFSPDSGRVATASNDGQIRVWSVRTGAQLYVPLKLNKARLRVQFSTDGKIICAAGDNEGRSWHAETGAPVSPSAVQFGKRMSSVEFAHDCLRFVTASDRGIVQIWDARTGERSSPAFKHQEWVQSAMFSMDGMLIVSASLDRTVRVWNANTGPAATPELQHEWPVASAQFSPDGTKIITASHDWTAQTWDARTGEKIGPPLKHDRGKVLDARFSPDGTLVVTAANNKTAQIWDAETGRIVVPPLLHKGVVLSAEFSPDGKRVVTATWGEISAAQVWDVSTGKAITAPMPHSHRVESARFSPDGRLIVTASTDGTARVWNAETGEAVTRPINLGSTGNYAEFSPDGKTIVTATRSSVVQIWDAFKGTPVSDQMRHKESVASAVFSPDGLKLVTASTDYTAVIWDVTTSKPIAPPLRHREPVSWAEFSSDGRRVVTASWDGTARVWDATTGDPLTPPFVHRNIDANRPDDVNIARFSPNGRYVVTASGNWTARVWRVPEPIYGQALIDRACATLPRGRPIGTRRLSDDLRKITFTPEGAGPCDRSGLLSTQYYKQIWCSTIGFGCDR